MIDKRAVLQGDVTVELLAPQQRVKTAGARPAVQAFLDALKPDPTYTYALVNAMGFSEYFGPNSNADWYGLNPHLGFNGLMHAWPDIGRDVAADRMKGKDWPYGYPCFYNAAVYAHHKNTDPVKLGFGDVIFAFANMEMKRIELMMRVHNEEARKKGHLTILERVAGGSRSDVSMGARVPFDTCVHPDVPLRTPGGWRRAGELQVGDSVLTHRGRIRKITRRFDNHVDAGDLLSLRVAGAPALLVTKTHPMYVVRESQLRACKGSAKGKKRRCTPNADGRACSFCRRALVLAPQWIDAGDVRIGDYVVAPRGELGATKIDPAKARLLGYWIGDGHRLRQRAGKKKDGDHRLMGFVFTVGVDAPEHYTRLVHTIREAGAKNNPNTYDVGEGRDAVQIHTYDQELGAWLCSVGATEDYEKRLAEEVFSWNQEALLQLIGGWIDTDGHFGDGLVRISTAVLGLALDAQRLLRLLGVPAGITPSPDGYGGTAYQVSIQPDHVQRLRLWNYCEKVDEFSFDHVSGTEILVVGDAVLHPVKKLEAVDYEGRVLNFSVEEDETYVAMGLSTHNCSICTDWDLYKKALKTFDPRRHRHEGIAVLEYHRKVRPIRGLAVTRDEYCSCMKTTKGKTLPSGDKVFVYNDYPRFFDISFVYIGADRTARVMWHLAQSLGRPVATDPMLGALERFLALGKVATMEKEVPGTVEQVLHDADTSPEFDLGALFPKTTPQQLLSSAASLGIVVTPGEFQALVAPGLDGLFDDRTSGVDAGMAVDPSKVLSGLLPALKHLCGERSSFAPYLEPRLPELPIPKVAQQDRPVQHTDVHAKIATLYNGYRLSVLEKSAALTQRAEGLFIDPLAKVAGAEALAGLLLGAAPVLHLVASHLRRQNDEGKQLGTMAQIVADNPTFLSLATLGAGIRMAMIAEKGGMLAALARLLQAVPKI